MYNFSIIIYNPNPEPVTVRLPHGSNVIMFRIYRSKIQGIIITLFIRFGIQFHFMHFTREFIQVQQIVK